MVETTVRKWGNSQGVVIPKSICEQARVHVGDTLVLEYDSGAIVMRRSQRTYRRKKTVTIDELFDRWEGSYEPPDDYPLHGNEIDWGETVGSEVLG